MAHVDAFAISLWPILALHIAEIYSMRLQPAMGVATAANWAASLVVSLRFLTFTDILGPSLTLRLYGLRTGGGVDLRVQARTRNQRPHARSK